MLDAGSVMLQIVGHVPDSGDLRTLLMRKRRVMVCNEPRFLRKLIAEAIAEEFETLCVEESFSLSIIEKTLAAFQPDCVIVTLESLDATPGICDVLFRRRPDLVVLAVAWPGNHAALFSYADRIHSEKIENTLQEVTHALEFGKPMLPQVVLRLSREVQDG
jgi:hypothetical protein